MSADKVRLTCGEAEKLAVLALKKAGVSDANATSVARALVAAEIDGQFGHGLSRIAAYTDQARSGKVAGAATPVLSQPVAALLRVDAANGFAFPAIDLAIDALANLAPETGIAAALIRRSHHCGQLGAHVERLAKHGLVALMVANAPPAMAAWGGSRPLLGTNPIAFAAPRSGQTPLVVDLSLSKVARGKVMAASKAGTTIPEGWAYDADGRTTTDPDAALKGTMLPAGEAKGAVLALIVEVLAGTLTGANHSYEATSFFDAEGKPPGVGQTFIALDPQCALGEMFSDRLEDLLSTITEEEGVRLPGMRRVELRAAARRNGIVIPAHIVSEVRALAER